MSEFEFKNRKLNIQKLLLFGFLEKSDCYIYSADLLDGQMKMTVSVSKCGMVSTRVTDNGSGEEYVLHQVPSASGAFVGRVKEEYEELLNEISAKCFDAEVFKSRQAKSVIAYIRDKYGDELEFLWEKFPNDAIARRKDNKKWYIALLTISRRKIGIDSDEMIEVIDLRMKPEDIEALVDNKKYFPGYHMNKKHWVTIPLNEAPSIDEIYEKIDDSYRLALK